MSKRKKEQDIELIPLVEDEAPQEKKTEDVHADNIQSEQTEEAETEEESISPEGQTNSEKNDASELFGAYVTEENKWERKNRIRDEKEKKKAAKKRAKYKDVDDETYESMKAHPAHIFFGVLSVLLLLAGITLATLGVYKLAIAPSYEKVGEKEKNLQVGGLATDGDADSLEQITVLQGVATPSDLVDTWVEQEFATQTDASQTAPEETTQADDESAAE